VRLRREFEHEARSLGVAGGAPVTAPGRLRSPIPPGPDDPPDRQALRHGSEKVRRVNVNTQTEVLR
jgi:hypothetical protein